MVTRKNTQTQDTTENYLVEIQTIKKQEIRNQSDKQTTSSPNNNNRQHSKVRTVWPNI